ncbi:MAG: 7-cyano-7-deazaguanine/7-aminomethyl-7-deazaguanine transporter [Gammaproteobacteria bacterium]|nr:7-cyano-7-deazaguanine/7-aminomethyl-7-deazaguanine transporter [Gammaproteobacteria bacterium]
MLLNETPRYQRALPILVLAHIVIIAASNYLVQIPLEAFSLTTTWGALTFPFIFLVTDLTVRIFGKSLARKIIFYTMIPALIISYYFSVIFSDGNFVGHSGLLEFDLFVFRIVLASFIAYIVGQLLDIQVFDKLRQISIWWIAPLASSVIGNLIDAICFFTIAFYKSSNEFMAANWVEIGSIDYLVKLIMSLCIFLPMYGILLKNLTRLLTKNPDKQKTILAE